MCLKQPKIRWVELDPFGYKDYSVSSDGDVLDRRRGKILAKHSHRAESPEERRFRLEQMEQGIIIPIASYQRVTFNRKRLDKSLGAVRNSRVGCLVVRAFLGPRPTASHTVDHINQIVSDDQLVNLRWATRREQLENRNISISYRKNCPILAIHKCGTWAETYRNVEELSVKLGKSVKEVADIIYSKKLVKGYYFVDLATRIGELIPKSGWIPVKFCGFKTFWVCDLGVIKMPDGRFTYGSLGSDGYRHIHLWKIGMGEKDEGRSDFFYVDPDTGHYNTKNPNSITVHRAVMYAFEGPNINLQVDHIDKCKDNNVLNNLRYVTKSENMQNVTRDKK